MVSHQPQPPHPTSQPHPRDRHAGRKSVSYKDAFRFGMWAGIIVFAVSAFVTVGSAFAVEGFRAVTSLGLPLIYGSVVFVAFTAMAALMNWVVSRKDTAQSIDKPVLD